MTTIPIRQIVPVNPNVIAAGGAASRLSGVLLSQSPSIAPGQQLAFYTAADVATWFGPSPEALAAAAYFAGIVNGGQLPYVLLLAPYVAAASGAGAYGARLSLTLAELQALSGTLVVTTSAQFTSSAIDLSTATSFSDAAAKMTAAFTIPDFAITYDAVRGRFLLLTSATGSAVTSTDVSGTLADAVGLSQASGAFIQTSGADVDTPATAMARVIAASTDWGTFSHAWTADITDRLAFAAWTSAQDDAYLYVSFDTETASIQTNNASSFGAQVFAANYQGTLPLYGGLDFAAGVMGYAASINYNVQNGRTTAAFRQFNAAIAATVSDLATANALLSNHYTYLGAYANPANTYSIVYNGQVSGAFLWVDTYLDQIYLNRELQRAFFETLLAYNSIPYNSDGYTALYRAGVDVITAALTSGIIRAGVTLSQSQAQQIDSQAGLSISPVVSSRGWYLQIKDPANAAQARQQRTSPSATLWWTDGGSVQQLTLSSTAVI